MTNLEQEQEQDRKLNAGRKSIRLSNGLTTSLDEDGNAEVDDSDNAHAIGQEDVNKKPAGAEKKEYNHRRFSKKFLDSDDELEPY